MQRPGEDVCGKEEEFKEGFLGMYLYLMGSPHSRGKSCEPNAKPVELSLVAAIWEGDKDS